MIRSLRARHRRAIAVVGIVTGALLVAALAVRRPVPRVEPLDLEGAALAFGDPSLAGSCAVAADGSVTVALERRAEAADPWLGVYWVPEDEAVGAALPERSFWLGHLEAPARRRFRLPAGERDGGRIVLYSLARHEVRDSARLPPEALR